MQIYVSCYNYYITTCHDIYHYIDILWQYYIVNRLKGTSIMSFQLILYTILYGLAFISGIDGKLKCQSPWDASLPCSSLSDSIL